jgi:DNA-binding NarL/FixJ family response regulator
VPSTQVASTVADHELIPLEVRVRVRHFAAEDPDRLAASLRDVAELLRLEGFDVVGEAGNAEELLALVRSERPDVAVVDVRMPPTHTVEGLEAARELRREHGLAVGVLVLSQHLEARHAVELLAESSEGIGYLLKDRVLSPQDLADAVRRVGGAAARPSIQKVVTQLMRRRHDDRGLGSLTDRERFFDKLDLADSPEAHRRVRAVLAWLR